MVHKGLVCENGDWKAINQALENFRVAVVKNFWTDPDFALLKQYQSSSEDWFFNSPNKLDYLTTDANDEGYHKLNEHWINPDYRDYKEGYGMLSRNDPASLPPEWGSQFIWVRDKLFDYVRDFATQWKFEDGLSYDHNISYVVHYPPCKDKHPCAPHFDRNIITTIVSHDPNKILQVKYQDDWLTVPFVENSVVLMVGMSFQWLTEDKIKACWHRVAPTDKSSFSTILFSYTTDRKINVMLNQWNDWKSKKAKKRDEALAWNDQ